MVERVNYVDVDVVCPAGMLLPPGILAPPPRLVPPTHGKCVLFNVFKSILCVIIADCSLVCQWDSFDSVTVKLEF